MEAKVSQDLIDAAAGYEDLLVPALFDQWPAKVLDAAQVGLADRVLDVACGTGVLARAAAERVGVSGHVAAVDPGPGMLAVARRLASSVEWQEGTAESLPFEVETFDAVVSQFGLMFFVDRDQAVREMLRVLKPRGRFAVAVWDALENVPAYATEVALLERLAGTDAADAVRAPFLLGDPAELGDLFEAAGARSVRVETHAGTGRFPSVRTMVEADLRGWLPVLGVLLNEDLIQQILNEAEEALGSHVTPEGTAEFEISAHVVSGSGS